MASLDVLERARETLATAELGLEDLESPNPGRRAAGSRNVLVWGRAVTNVLQNLRGEVDDFDVWYAPWQAEMSADALLRFVYKLRSVVLKEGVVATSNVTHVVSFSSADIPPPPPGAVGFFLGDATGGNGWVVKRGGVEEKVYVEMPPDKVRSWLELSGTPTEHLGNPLEDLSVEAVAALYLAYLRRMLEDAERRFA